jgi:predicted dehydrogenase
LVHIPAALRAEGAELVAICDVYEDVARKVADKYRVDKYYSDAQKMYDSEEIDAVLVLTSHAQHEAPTVQAAENGKHILVEKPMGVTIDQCEHMISACRKAGVSLMLAFMKRFDPSLQWIKEKMEGGKLGTPFVINSWYCDSAHHMDYVKGFLSSFVKPENPRFAHPMPEVGNHKWQLLTHGVHHMDLLHWMGGTVSTMTTRYNEMDPRTFVSTTVLEYENGSSGYFQLAGVLARDWTEGLQVHGTEGSAEAEILFPYYRRPSPVSVYTKGTGAYSTVMPSSRDQYLGEIQHFVDSVAKGIEPEPGGEDGLFAQRMVEAAARSASEGSTVEV